MIGRQKASVIGQIRQAVDGHSSLYPAVQRGGLVQCVIMPGVLSQHKQDWVQVCTRGMGVMALVWLWYPADIIEYARGQLRGGRDDIGTAGGNGASRHGVKLCGLRGLHYREPAGGLDGLQAQRAIRTHARK